MTKGRDKDLVELRNEKLLQRYFELTEVQNLRFDRALTLLSREEFFISEARIMTIVRRNYRKLEQMTAKSTPKMRMPRLTTKQTALFE